MNHATPPFRSLWKEISKKCAGGALLCEVVMQARLEKRLLAAAMVRATLTAVVLIAATDPSLAEAPTQQQIDWCTNQDHKFSADQQINGCTAAIESGKWSGKGLAWAFNDRGFGYLLNDDLNRALADFTEAIRLDPNDAVAFANRGIIYQMRGDFDQAMAEYDAAVRLDPTYALAFQNRGDAHARKGEPDSAIADFTEAIRLDPAFTVALTGRGNTYLGNKQIDSAIADYSQVIQLDPQNADAFSNRCFAFELKGDNDRALADCDQAVRLNAQDGGAFNNRGNAYQAKGDFAHAIADFTEAIRLDPQGPQPYYNRGVAYVYSGSLAQAAADFDRSNELGPANPYTALWLDITNARANLPSHFGQAVPRLDMSKWPAPLVRLYLGQATAEEVLAAANDADTATQQRRVCEANFFIGQLALRRHAKDEAGRRFRQVVANCPQIPMLSTFGVAELKELETQP